MIINTYLSTIESKKQTKQKKEQKQNHRYREHFDGGQKGWRSGDGWKR